MYMHERTTYVIHKRERERERERERALTGSPTKIIRNCLSLALSGTAQSGVSKVR